MADPDQEIREDSTVLVEEGTGELGDKKERWEQNEDCFISKKTTYVILHLLPVDFHPIQVNQQTFCPVAQLMMIQLRDHVSHCELPHQTSWWKLCHLSTVAEEQRAGPKMVLC